MIAQRAVEQDITRLGWIDYLLMGSASGLAVFAGAQAVAAVASAPIFVGLVLLGTIVSALVQSSLSERFAKLVGGIAYALLALACFATWRNFNMLMPEKVLAETRELAPAGFLIWMIVYGSFASWRDSTLLFQSVPGIAIFGLVGCYDTYRPAPFLFFGFLLCLCTMFARAHARTMLEQAAASGYQARVAQEALSTGDPAKAGRWVDAIRRGPWKWVAGPEWALASAASVVLISLLGAPVIQRSVSGVSGFVKLNVPVRATPPPPPGVLSSANGNISSARIGQGPSRLSDTPLFRARTDVLRYMRSGTYHSYSGMGWEQYRAFGNPSFMNTEDAPEARDIRTEAISRMKDAKRIEWTVEKLTLAGNSIPTPGEVVGLSLRVGEYDLGGDGIVGTNRQTAPLPRVSGQSLVVDGATPTYAASNIPLQMDQTLSTERVSDRLQEDVLKSTTQAGNDYEKAQAWKREIERRCRYNLNAAATPQGEDPVEYFLYESNEGYCDLFASSMVLGARVLNIPARYVVGFLPDPERDADGKFVLRESDAHAWAELFFEGVGWVIFDATEGAASVEGGARGSSNTGHEWWRQTWVLALAGFAGISALGFAFWFAMGKAKAAAVLVDPVRRALDREYSLFVRVLTKVGGKPRMLSSTPDEFLDSVRGQLGPYETKAESINQRFVGYLYSPSGPDPKDLASLKAEIRELASGLKKR